MAKAQTGSQPQDEVFENGRQPEDEQHEEHTGDDVQPEEHTGEDAQPEEEPQPEDGILNLFQDNTRASAFGNKNQLECTAALTNLSVMLANQVQQILFGDAKLWADKVKKSMESHDAMDALLAETVDYSVLELDFLPKDEEIIEKMIRSQQSKRSRAKGKTMTLENYKTMLVGAIAENLLRLVSGKAKSSGGGATTKELAYTDEQLAEYAKDAEKLAKEIRNIQSKKSIMKAKAGYSDEDPRWHQLLHAEETLKDIRDHGITKVTEEAAKAVEVTETLKQQLGEVDINDLTPEQAKELLDSVQQMLASK